MSDTASIQAALTKGGVIDITTTGAKTGQARRVEIVFFPIDGRIYITGSPGRRAWIANLNADPHMTFHLKKGLTADLPATARVISDPDERRPIITHVTTAWNKEAAFEAFFEDAPLIEVTFDDATILEPAADAA